ncbi:MAG: hypothetical protein KJ017_04535 [Alphaproteobacteria bacterium]|nr:hypothetical protein [Alphaproteobacteria bacterium]
MKTARKNAALWICAALLGVAAFAHPAQAVERKPPLHIKVNEDGKTKKQIPAQTPTTESANPDKKQQPPRKISTSACPVIITAKAANHYGLRVNLIRQDRRALQLATALREDFFRKGRDTQFISALYDASVQTETDFELLVIKAMMESNLGMLNFAETTTARGAFQYIESTWLNLMHRYGAKAGYPEYAKAIRLDPVTMVANLQPEQESKRTEILTLRFEPYIASLMKSFQIAEETAEIQKITKTNFVSITDHYVTHMLGLPLARKFYEMKNENSKEPLADPKRPAMLAAAEKNRHFFFDDDGNALSAAQSYTQFENRVTSARRRLYDIVRKYTNKRGGCGPIEPIPAYETTKPSPAAKEAPSNSLNFSFFDMLLTGGQTEAQPEIPETAAGEEKIEEKSEEKEPQPHETAKAPDIKPAPTPKPESVAITPPPSAP